MKIRHFFNTFIVTVTVLAGLFLITPEMIGAQTRNITLIRSTNTVKINSVSPGVLSLNKGFPGSEIIISGSNLDKADDISVVFRGQPVRGISVRTISAGYTSLKIQLAASFTASTGGPYQLQFTDRSTNAVIPVPLNTFSLSVKLSKAVASVAERNTFPGVQRNAAQNQIVDPRTAFSTQKTKLIEWSGIILLWDLLKSSFEINLNNWNGQGPKENDTSYVYFYDKKYSIDIPAIEFEKKLLGLRFKFLVNNLKTIKGGSGLSRKGCKNNQLKIAVGFESSGMEVKGYGKVILTGTLMTGKLPDRNWHDSRGPDFQINNAREEVTFNFYYANGNLGYNATSDFSADIKAGSGIVQVVLDTFISNWRSQMVKRVNQGVSVTLNSSYVKNLFVGKIMGIVKKLLPAGARITGMDFYPEGIKVSYD